MPTPKKAAAPTSTPSTAKPAPAPAKPEPTSPAVVPVNVVTSISAEERTIAVHVAAALGAVGGVISIVHPGFQMPAVAETIATAVSWGGAVALEVYELVTKRGLVKAIAALAASKS